MRIVSLLPSATEIVCQLGLQPQLVGVTHECDYPPGVSALPKVTTTLIPKHASSGEIDALVRERLVDNSALYSLNMEILADARPELIVTQALCDVCAVAETEVRAAARALPGGARVVNLQPMSLQDVFDTLLLVGKATDSLQRARDEVAALQARVDAVRARSRQLTAAQQPSVAFLEWIDPPFNAGHWTPELIAIAGGRDCIGNLHRPSVTTAWDAIVAAKPDVMFIALCGFDVDRARMDLPLLARNPGWATLPCARNRRVYLADGNAYFSRSGPRLVDSLELLAHALHPQIHPPPPTAARAIEVSDECNASLPAD